MCDIDGIGASCSSQRWRKARKSHWCCACGEGIKKGHRYHVVSGIWDGSPSTYKHCARCWAMFEAILDEAVKHDRDALVVFTLDCGERWEDNFGELPDDVAALAFALPGEMEALA